MTQALAELLEDPTLPELSAQITDRLEFERRERERFIEEVDDSVKAEFINGEIIMHSPSTDWHAVAQMKLSRLLDTFVELHALGTVRGEKTLCRFPRNDYEPDVIFFGPAKSATIFGDTTIYPVPDFVCEILSKTTKKRDRGVKFRDYEAQGVMEYWIYDPELKVLEQYLMRDGKYALIFKGSSGEVTSAAVPGFRIPVAAISDSDENLRVLFAMKPAV